MTFRRALIFVVMAADFLALGQGHDAVLVMLGMDEHRYVRFAQQARRCMDEHVPIRSDFALTAAYTRIVKGFSCHSKVSKSIPGSALDVTVPPKDVHRLLARRAPIPAESTTYQLMCQMPRYDTRALMDLTDNASTAVRSGNGRCPSSRRPRDRADQPLATLTRRNCLGTAR